MIDKSIVPKRVKNYKSIPNRGDVSLLLGCCSGLIKIKGGGDI